MNLEDPMIRRRVIQLMVTVSTSALHKKADLMLKILEHVCPTFPQFPNMYIIKLTSILPTDIAYATDGIRNKSCIH